MSLPCSIRSNTNDGVTGIAGMSLVLTPPSPPRMTTT